MTQALGQKSITKVKTNSDGEMKWDPSPEELRAGIEHINNHAPLANAKNGQFLWSLLNIRDKDSPICGVGKACGNRATGNSQSEPEYFFPLLLRDLNSEFQRTVVPMILPTLLSFGLIILGKPGIGKTPAAIIMVMAVARYLIQARKRTATSLDGDAPNRSMDLENDPGRFTSLSSWTIRSFPPSMSKISNRSWTWARMVWWMHAIAQLSLSGISAEFFLTMNGPLRRNQSMLACL